MHTCIMDKTKKYMQMIIATLYIISLALDVNALCCWVCISCQCSPGQLSIQAKLSQGSILLAEVGLERGVLCWTLHISINFAISSQTSSYTYLYLLVTQVTNSNQWYLILTTSNKHLLNGDVLCHRKYIPYSHKIWWRIKFGGLAVCPYTANLKSTNIFARLWCNLDSTPAHSIELWHNSAISMHVAAPPN